MTNALQVYDRKQVEKFAVQLVESMPGSRRLDLQQALALAQISLIHGLDPYNGEAWFIPGSGVMVGIKGLRKLARKQLDKESDERARYWIQFHRELQPAKYDANDEDLVEICELRDSESIAAWTEAMERLIKLGLDIKDAKAAAGNPPVTIGVGVVKASEASKMPRKQLAMKRAEAHAIKQRFDVEFELLELPDDPSPYNGNIAGITDEGEIIDAEIKEEESKPLRPYTAHFLRAKISDLAGDRNAIGADCSKQDRNLVDSALAMTLSKEADRKKVLEWLTGAETISKVSAGHIIAMLKWVEVKEVEVNPPQYVMEEIRSVLEEADKEDQDG